MVLIQPEYFYSQECHLMDRGYQVLGKVRISGEILLG